MYTIKTSGTFEKDLIRCIKRNYELKPFEDAVILLERLGKLPAKYKPHQLSGRYKGFWECHIKPDWLIIWRQNDSTRVIELTRTGSHSDLFK
jgi:mRNA interferase YafQ